MAIRKMNTDKAIRVLRVLRLALSGAIAGTALAGLVFPGFAHQYSIDAIGAGTGFVAVLAVKAAHLI